MTGICISLDDIERVTNLKFEHTNEILPYSRLVRIIAELENTIPNFPRLNRKTISYDYEKDSCIISLYWGGIYHISEDHGRYIIDLNDDGDIIGIELFNFNVTR